METHVPGRVLGDLKTGRWRVHGFFPRRSMWGAAWEPVSPPLWRGPVRLSPAASRLWAEGASGPVGTAPCPGWVWSRALDLGWLRVPARSRAEVGLSGGLGSCAFLFSKSPSGSARGIFVGFSGPAALASQGRVRHVDSQPGQSEALGCPPHYPRRPSGAKGVRHRGGGDAVCPGTPTESRRDLKEEVIAAPRWPVPGAGGGGSPRGHVHL